MRLKNKLKDLKVAGKLNVYRMCMIFLMVIMGVASLLLSMVMNTKVHEITDVWSPSLSCVQELNRLTSEYRLKQYGHLVATDESGIASYEEELESIDSDITSVSGSFQKLISTDVETEQYENIQEKWQLYKEQSEQILALSREGKTEEAGLLMVGEIYDTYKDFGESFNELQDYENNELTAAEGVVATVFVLTIIMIIVIVALAIAAATYIGKTIGIMITEPVEQIEQAVIAMREGDFSKGNLLTYESEDELGVVEEK